MLTNTPKNLPVKVYEIGSGPRDTSLWAKHTQSDFEIIWILEGSGSHIINGEQYQLSQNVIYVALPGDYHELVIKPGTQGYIVSFNTTQLSQADSDYHTIDESWLYYYFSKTPVLALDGSKHDKMKNLIMLMENESSTVSPLHSEINSKCLQLFQLYLRQHIESSPDLSSPYKMSTLLKQYLWLVEKDFQNTEECGILCQGVERLGQLPEPYHKTGFGISGKLPYPPALIPGSQEKSPICRIQHERDRLLPQLYRHIPFQ